MALHFFSCLSTQNNVTCNLKVTVDLHFGGNAFEPQLDSFFFLLIHSHKVIQYNVILTVHRH